VLRKLQTGGPEQTMRLFGPRDNHLRRLREAFGVRLAARGEHVQIEGPEQAVLGCEAALEQMRRHLEEGRHLSDEVLEGIIRSAHSRVAAPSGTRLPELWPGVAPRTPGQAAYVEALQRNDVVLCIGPAGTGKTYLGVAVACSYLKDGVLNRIVLCRPAVEAGESLGFLPGDIYAKVNPYLRPLYDALHDLMDARRVKRYIDNDLIEILPLAFVRGRTLDNAFIILDEAQNCTVGQMKMFLTRLGRHAKLLVTGDITQIDLPPEERSGLVDALERLRGLRGIGFVRLTEKDIVRHELVRSILDAYERELPARAKPEPAPREADDAER